ncbi:hypothetical protein EGJ27_24545 [Pseudomonas sp. v388]|uniref:hypothetical protein n=1 Tax=Pseudomonas sp. v388 TaxID=2479849 RepID=UPI000F7A401D|nr:hypothetical protein [Pseudomonas sp. v388]RRV03670.1 hypothetical protein EGJ27_24545 [Pseudomonas sp. v388]
MASHSLQSLLAWMKDTSRLWGWDAIVALAAPQVNRGLQDVYTRRLLESGDQPVPAGAFTIPDTDLTVYLQDVVLAAPVFSFEQASLDHTDMSMTLPLLIGREVLLKAGGGGSAIQRIAIYEPENAPPVQVELKLHTGPRTVELDLAQSVEVKFMFGPSLVQQLEGGKFFGQWLQSPENRQRTFALVSFPDQGNPLMSTRRIDVRTQSDKAPAGAARQALMLFITMEHGVTGAVPADADPQFLYLIPNDADQAFSSAAMFSLHLQHRAAFGQAVLQMLGNPPFDYSGDASGLLKKMTAGGGTVQVPALNYQSGNYVFESQAFSIEAASGAEPLSVEFEPAQATQRWRFSCTVTFKYRCLPDTEWIAHTASFDVLLEHEFHLGPDESGASAMEGHLFAPYALSDEVRPMSGLPGNLPPDDLAEITGFVGYALKRALLEKLSETLTVTQTDIFLGGCSFADSHRLHPSVTALPHDLALFGKVGGSPSPLSIVEQQIFLAAGAQQQFTAAPPVAGLRWSVESLPGSVGNPGTIDEQTGLYRAPPAHAMGGLFERVMVAVTDPQTSDVSMAPVTVFAHRIMITPLLHVCNYGERVELSAAGLGVGTLTWAIKNPVPGESGELVLSTEPGGDHTYIAHGKVQEKSFVFEEIEVGTGETGQSVSAFIVVQHLSQSLSVKPLEDAGLPAGQVQLQATVRETVVAAQWSLPFGGPGSLGADGIYTAQPSAKDLFVIILATYESELIGKLEGYLVLPLPLADSSGLIKILAR